MNIKEQTIAHIGLGRMGSGIAKNIQAAGCHFVVYNRSTEKMQPFVATGAKAARTPREAASDADIVVTSLMDDKSVFDVMLGEDGLLAGLCPNNKITGGRVLKSRTRKTVNRARTILCLCAQSLLRSQSALGAFCRRLCSRIGKPKGIIATAHKLAVLVYRMLKGGADYTNIGQEQYDNQFKERALKSLARKAKELGLQLVPCPEK